MIVCPGFQHFLNDIQRILLVTKVKSRNTGKRMGGRPHSARRFLPPWSAEVTPNCFIVRDANGQALAYVYYEDELPGDRTSAVSFLHTEIV